MRISSVFNRQGGERYTDRYWGEIPMFLKYLPEAKVCVPNTDFVDVFNGLLDGSINQRNVSKIILDDINIILEIMADPIKACMVDRKYSLMIEVIKGNQSPCEINAQCKADCDQLICCHTTFSCSCI